MTFRENALENVPCLCNTFCMKKSISKKAISKRIVKGPTLSDWKKLVLPETKKTASIDAQKILIEMRYGRNASN